MASYMETNNLTDMKHKVKLSGWSTGISLFCMGVIVAVMLFGAYKNDPWLLYPEAVFIIVFNLFALWYAPLYISVDKENISVHRSLRIKDLPLREVVSAELCPPTMGERRVFASGGYLGYWGWFREKPEGKYFAYYGRASDCFLVTLRDGRKYMLGCENPGPVVDFIKAHIN